MSTTRRSADADPYSSPERNLSSVRLRPVNVSLAIASQAARTYDAEARAAVLWLANVAANSQRLQVCWQLRSGPDGRSLRDPLGTVGRITEADLARRLGLDPLAIFHALTGHPDAELPAFTEAVRKLRAEFEAALPPLVRTEDTRTVEAAFHAAAEQHDIAIVSGKWRHGKTEEAQRLWLKNLHRAVWVNCPENADERSFIIALATALGIGVGTGVKPSQLREKLKRGLCVGLIDTLFIDEAHFLWPGDLRSAKPARAELVRHLHDALGVGFVLITTDQFALSMELARQHSTRWAPGQLAGRQQPFRLRDTHSDGEKKGYRAVARGGDRRCGFEWTTELRPR